MIEYLRGILLEHRDHHVVLDANGIGYGLTVPATTASQLGPSGSEAALWVLTYVREDALRLYGFASRHEREAFEVFLGMPGVGPNLGLAIMSTLSVAEIVQATLNADARLLTRVRGIGQKTAEKLLLELRNRIDRLSAGLEPDVLSEACAETNVQGQCGSDAVAALEALDVPPTQARRAISRAQQALGGAADVQALIREGLKYRH